MTDLRVGASALSDEFAEREQTVGWRRGYAVGLAMTGKKPSPGEFRTKAGPSSPHRPPQRDGRPDEANPESARAVGRIQGCCAGVDGSGRGRCNARSGPDAAS